MADDFMSILNTFVAPLYKTKYGPMMERELIDDTRVLNMFKRTNDVEGAIMTRGVPMSHIGGFSMNAPGDASFAEYAQMSYSVKKLFHAGRLDRLSMKLARSDKGSFERLVDEQMLLIKRAYSLNQERMAVQGDGTGLLGSIASVTDNGGGDYSAVISTTTAPGWIRQNFQRGFNVNIGSSSTDSFRISHVYFDTLTVQMVRASGSSYVPQVGDGIYIKDCRNQEWLGLRGVLSATSGSLYGLTVQDGWRSINKTYTNQPISADILIDAAMDVANEVFETPNLLITDYLQEKKLIKMGEHNKLLTYSSVESNGFVMGCVPHLFIRGKQVPILSTPFMPQGEVYFVNTDKLEIASTGDGEFIQQNGSPLWYEGVYNKTDTLSCLWVEYSVPVIDPRYHCRISGLDISATAP